jgi:hypothetical protein
MIGARVHKSFPFNRSHVAPAIAFLFSFGVLTFSTPAGKKNEPVKPTVIRSSPEEAATLPLPLDVIERKEPVRKDSTTIHAKMGT